MHFNYFFILVNLLQLLEVDFSLKLGELENAEDQSNFFLFDDQGPGTLSFLSSLIEVSDLQAHVVLALSWLICLCNDSLGEPQN